MNKQRIAQQGSPRDLFETPADEFVADFICKANLVSGEVRDHESDRSERLIGGAMVIVPDHQARLGDVRIVVCPDPFRLLGDAASHALSGEFVYASFLGTEMQYTLHTPLGELIVRSSDVFNTHPR
jgi:iron(III) transport system ATP-binding protein